MAKGKLKGRKRKFGGISGSEESSSQSQDTQEISEDTQPKARYVPRFGNPSKKAKFDLNKVGTTPEAEVQVQIDSCTQPDMLVKEKACTTDVAVSATQPVSPKVASEDYSRMSSNPTQHSSPIIPGLSLTQVQTISRTHTTSQNQTLTPPHDMCTDGDTHTSDDEVKPHTNDGQELHTPAHGPECFTSPKENMNLEFLNPFSEEEQPIIEHPVPTEQKSQDASGSVKCVDITESESVNPPNEDATLPDSQSLPDNAAMDADTMYNDPQGKTKTENNIGRCILKMENTKSLHTGEDSVRCEEVEEAVLKEMIALRAEDFLESQFNTDTAIVPSVSPIKGGPQGTSQPPKRASYSFNQLNNDSSHAEGQGVLRGLIQELSTINQYILRCKRELEAARKQRDVWLRTRQPQRHR